MACGYSLIGIIIFLRDDACDLVVVLTIHTSSCWCIGRTVFKARSTNLVLWCRTISLRIPLIPQVRVVDIVGQDVACIVADIIRRAEYLIEVDILLLHHMVNGRIGSLQRTIL